MKVKLDYKQKQQIKIEMVAIRHVLERGITTGDFRSLLATTGIFDIILQVCAAGKLLGISKKDLAADCCFSERQLYNYLERQCLPSEPAALKIKNLRDRLIASLTKKHLEVRSDVIKRACEIAKQEGVTRKDLAEEWGISTRLIYFYLTGTVQPNEKVVAKARDTMVRLDQVQRRRKGLLKTRRELFGY